MAHHAKTHSIKSSNVILTDLPRIYSRMDSMRGNLRGILRLEISRHEELFSIVL